MQGVFIEPGTEGWTLRTSNGVELYKFKFRMEALSEPYTLFDFYETIEKERETNKVAINRKRFTGAKISEKQKLFVSAAVCG